MIFTETDEAYTILSAEISIKSPIFFHPLQLQIYVCKYNLFLIRIQLRLTNA